LPHRVHSAYLSRSAVSTARQLCNPIRQRQRPGCHGAAELSNDPPADMLASKTKMGVIS
jgi:hypothetical protein